jgi:hypothetical protein
MSVPKSEIKTSLTYWHNAKMVAVDQILAFDQVQTARRYCECMRVGVFHPDVVSDLSIWRALLEMREEQAIPPNRGIT